MKFLLKVTTGPEHSFVVANEECAYFFDEFHYHPQIELTLILKGAGTRFVGDSIERFTEGDLVLVGSNLPHVWKSNIEYYERNTTLRSESIVVHFGLDFLGKTFFDVPEFKLVRQLLEESSGGLVIEGRTRKVVAREMRKLIRRTQSERLILLLDMLRRISSSREYKLLSSASMVNAYRPHDSERIKKVHQYVVARFRAPLKLQDVAEHVSMSRTAFCRYFKQRTRKTFSSFLNEMRVAYACRLLLENKMKIAQVCFESGFANISNFNVQFKAVMKMTPQQYMLLRGTI